MFGKASIILVVGFGLVFAIYQMKVSKVAATASDTYNSHYMSTLNSEAANSTMNVTINQLWQTAVDSMDAVAYIGPCTTNVRVRPAGQDSVIARVVSRTSVINEEYWATHGGRMPIADSVMAIFETSYPPFRYFMYSNTEATHMGLRQFWMNGDTAWGPIHTNGIFYTFGSPVFLDKVSAEQGFQPYPEKSPAEYLGGWEAGVNIPFPTDMSNLTIAATRDDPQDNTRSCYNEDLWLEFFEDGTVARAIDTLATSFDTVTGEWETLPLTTLAPNHVMWCTADINVKGTLNGEVTLFADMGSDIKIHDDMVYKVDPTEDPTSDDILGLIADHDVIILNNADTENGVEIHAAIVALTGSFWAEEWDTIPPAVDPLRLVGSIMQNYRGPVGSWTGNGSWHQNGFERDYHYDPRFAWLKLPYWPTVEKLKLVAWWE